MPRSRDFDKEIVLEKAMMLFWEQGYEATSMRALQKATGISSSSMYETFGDKRSIFLTVLARYCAIEQENIAEMVEKTPDAHEFIRNLFSSIDRILPDASQNYGSMTFNTMAEFGMRDQDVTELLYAHFVALSAIIEAVIQKAQDENHISSRTNPHDLSHFILSTLQGLATLKSMKPDYPHSAFVNIIDKLLTS